MGNQINQLLVGLGVLLFLISLVAAYPSFKVNRGINTENIGPEKQVLRHRGRGRVGPTDIERLGIPESRPRKPTKEVPVDESDDALSDGFINWSKTEDADSLPTSKMTSMMENMVMTNSDFCLTCGGSSCPRGMVRTHSGSCVPKGNW